MSEKIKDGNIVIYRSEFSRSLIKDRELYDQYKGVPYVVKEISNRLCLFWKGHEGKTIFKEGDKTLTYLGSDNNFKVVGNVEMPRKKYKEESGYDLINTIDDFDRAQEIFNGNTESEPKNDERHSDDDKGGRLKKTK
jgi:hypothetical protein